MTYDLPPAYAFLADEPAPRMLLEALRLYGTLEAPGKRDNPVILAWADELAKVPGLAWLGSWYEEDSIPWCGLFMGIVAHRAGKPVQGDLLAARGWLDWGNAVDGEPVLGDVLVFWRGSRHGRSGHVGLYVGEDAEHYHVLGGNQSDAVTITRISKARLLAARNLYRYAQPDNCRRIEIAADGDVSENEA
ncbi:TIGR02594 family protein [Hyphobacterium sp.]|uniref:TIGR02594 family protein n=1 Tax=Hyphobacterium sp. TaxID=2004662 RepID=UPI003B51CE90